MSISHGRRQKQCFSCVKGCRSTFDIKNVIQSVLVLSGSIFSLSNIKADGSGLIRRDQGNYKVRPTPGCLNSYKVNIKTKTPKPLYSEKKAIIRANICVKGSVKDSFGCLLCEF